MQPKLSIVIPTIGESKYLAAGIDSASAAASEDTEVLVFFNRYRGGLDISGTHGQVRVETTSEDLLAHESWNRAVNLSRGEFVFVLSDDDLVSPDFVANLKLPSLGTTSLAMPAFQFINRAGEITGESPQASFDVNDPPDIDLEAFIRGKFFTNLGLFVFPRQLFESLGGFRYLGTDNGYYSDELFNLQLIANCSDISIRPDARWSYRLHYRQQSRRNSPEDMKEILSSYIHAACETPSIRREIERIKGGADECIESMHEYYLEGEYFRKLKEFI